MADTNVKPRGRCRVRKAAYRARRFILKTARRERRQAKRVAEIAKLIDANRPIEPPAQLYYCRNCGEECASSEDCCTDEFPEPGEMRETGR